MSAVAWGARGADLIAFSTLNLKVINASYLLAILVFEPLGVELGMLPRVGIPEKQLVTRWTSSCSRPNRMNDLESGGIG